MPTYEQLYAFLLKNYRPSRFEQHSDKGKPDRICKMYLDDLQKYGVAYISRHEDPLGQGLKFYPSLEIERGERIEYRNSAGHLTHLF
ncbi:hypothetical protein PMPD1_3123 [Paramixta manurensis]|uniref:Uncharacterized protein n=1 Tax=Paramixta manurensis TaxID=2740817 RepID=A0A6M8UBM2_9GAMM|nr:hypothetical protein PMPD1_3123 [Erwiniaceae bacterium PD-1]